MSTTIEYSLLHSVRLTGRINNEGQLEIITKRAQELVEQLLVSTDRPPQVRIQLHDFPQNPAAGDDQWRFETSTGWERSGTYIWTTITELTDEEGFQPIALLARAGEGTTAQEKPKTILIRVEPIVDAPDGS